MLVLFAPGPDAVVVDKSKPETAPPWAAMRLSRRLSPGRISRRACVSMTPSSEMTELKVMLLTWAGSNLVGLMALEFQRELERRLQQPVGEAGGNGGQVLFQHARNALPFGRLQGRRQLRPPSLAGAGRIAR